MKVDPSYFFGLIPRHYAVYTHRLAVVFGYVLGVLAIRWADYRRPVSQRCRGRSNDVSWSPRQQGLISVDGVVAGGDPYRPKGAHHLT